MPYSSSAVLLRRCGRRVHGSRCESLQLPADVDLHHFRGCSRKTSWQPAELSHRRLNQIASAQLQAAQRAQRRTDLQHFGMFRRMSAEPRLVPAVKRAITLHESRRMGWVQAQRSHRLGACVRFGTATPRCLHAARGIGPQMMHRRHAAGLSTQCAILWAASDSVCGTAAAASQRRPTNVLAAARAFAMRRPFLTNVLMGVGVYTVADYAVQSAEEDAEIDTKRLLSFACFGVVNSCIGWAVYVNLFAKLAPTSIRFSNLSMSEKLRDRQGQKDVVKQVCLDNFAYTPFVFFPHYYLCKVALQDDGELQPETIIRGAAERCRENFIPDNWASLKIWLFADVLVFAVPTWLRMPVLQITNMGFTMLLSHMRGSSGVAAASLPEDGAITKGISLPETGDAFSGLFVPQWLGSAQATLSTSFSQLRALLDEMRGSLRCLTCDPAVTELALAWRVRFHVWLHDLQATLATIPIVCKVISSDAWTDSSWSNA